MIEPVQVSSSKDCVINYKSVVRCLISYLRLAICFNQRFKDEQSEVSLEHFTQHLSKQGNLEYSLLLVGLVVIQQSGEGVVLHFYT